MSSPTSLNKHIDTLFLITHTSTFNTSLQALLLIQQISSSLSHSPESSSSALSKSIVDRYYRTLYQSLHDSRLASSSKQTMYLNLLFKSLKVDGNPERVKSFVRRFVQVLASGGAGGTEFVVGGLYLLGEVMFLHIIFNYLAEMICSYLAQFQACGTCSTDPIPLPKSVTTHESETHNLRIHQLLPCSNW